MPHGVRGASTNSFHFFVVKSVRSFRGPLISFESFITPVWGISPTGRPVDSFTASGPGIGRTKNSNFTKVHATFMIIILKYLVYMLLVLLSSLYSQRLVNLSIGIQPVSTSDIDK
jgi:hypothetical protein